MSPGNVPPSKDMGTIIGMQIIGNQGLKEHTQDMVMGIKDMDMVLHVDMHTHPIETHTLDIINIKDFDPVMLLLRTNTELSFIFANL